MKKKLGFTLVELLIVIALIGILAVAIVATINPIEQINRARDARYKNDASELLAAIERYYASTQQYPWMTIDPDNYNSNAVEYSGLGNYGGVGVCAAAEEGAAGTPGNCNKDGILITSDELKTQFRKKEQFSSSATDIDRFYVYKPENTSSVYVCFIPKAKVNRTPSSSVRLWDLGISDPDGSPLEITEVTDTDDLANLSWTDRTNSLFICVPE